MAWLIKDACHNDITVFIRDCDVKLHSGLGEGHETKFGWFGKKMGNLAHLVTA